VPTTIHIKKPKVDWSDYLLEQIVNFGGLPEIPIREYKFHPTRRWRFDLAFIDHKLAIEIEGGVWIRGRHTRGSGFISDMDKYNNAVLLSWYMLRFTPNDVKVGKALQTINSFFKGECVE
tara:strand:- start:2846 stop:3205 length:360 start_codon:yes stop_codon:yes gene_type:complete